jgi:hypothetical protein
VAYRHLGISATRVDANEESTPDEGAGCASSIRSAAELAHYIGAEFEDHLFPIWDQTFSWLVRFRCSM